MKADKFARTGAHLRVPTIDPNALYKRQEVKHLLRGVGDEALSDMVTSGELRHAKIGGRGDWRIRGKWLLDFIESKADGKTTEETGT